MIDKQITYEGRGSLIDTLSIFGSGRDPTKDVAVLVTIAPLY